MSVRKRPSRPSRTSSPAVPSRSREAAKLQQLFALYWADLCFMAKELARQESQLRDTVPPEDANGAVQLQRLQFFIQYISSVMDKMAWARTQEADAAAAPAVYSMQELSELEHHLISELIPIKQNLLRSLQDQGANFQPTLFEPVKPDWRVFSGVHNRTPTDSPSFGPPGSFLDVKREQFTPSPMALFQMASLTLLQAQDPSTAEVSTDTDSEWCTEARTEPVSKGRPARRAARVSESKQIHTSRTGGKRAKRSPLHTQTDVVTQSPARYIQPSPTSSLDSEPKTRSGTRHTPAQPSVVSSAGKSHAGRKRHRAMKIAATRAPRDVYYECAICRGTFTASISENPWWSLARVECPLCHSLQTPRVDISHPLNSNEAHSIALSYPDNDFGAADSESEASYSGTSDDEDANYAHPEGFLALAAYKDAQNHSNGTTNGFADKPFDPHQGAKLLILMEHARTCPGRHTSVMHAEVCRSIKFLMLHMRDCGGKVRSGEDCAFPWCASSKVLLCHLLECPHPDRCRMCCPLTLPPRLRELRNINRAAAAQQ